MMKADRKTIRALAPNAPGKLFFETATFNERQVDWRPESEILMRSI
jgi:hypothetical protein